MQTKTVNRPLKAHLVLAAPITASISLLLCALVSENVQATPIAMPAGSTVWMELNSNACDPDGDSDCTGSNQLGANPSGGIAPITFNDGTEVSGSAEVFPDRMRAYVSANTGSFMYLSMLDTYTVHGTTSDTFAITVNFALSGTASSRAAGPFQQLVGATALLEIGTFSPSTAPGFLESFRVTAFGPGNFAQVSLPTQSASLGSPFERAMTVATSYTRTVGVGDIFDLAYGLTASVVNGTLDLRNTAVISFDLPEGVYLTSAQGGTFGIVPVPAAAWLFASGIAALGALRRSRTVRV